MKAAKIFDIFCIGSARKYRSIDAQILAKKMASTLDATPGVHYYYFDDFLKLDFLILIFIAFQNQDLIILDLKSVTGIICAI